jgi:alkylation response protein AidB-like acyl-CoA dehydrogenase
VAVASGLMGDGDDAPSEAALREEARSFLAATLDPRRTGGLPQVMGAGSDDLDVARAFLRRLGPWAVPRWPRESGGLGASARQAEVVAEELAGFDAPDLYPFMVGLSLVGPTVLEHGTAEQQARWLPAIRTGDEVWCQLFSEPGAGSDLAALACRAVRDGDVWRVTGQKVWSSRAHYSRWGLLLARTDPDVAKHAGISCFAVDLTRPGVEVRPLVQANGDTHFNEVFLDEVEVPDADCIGPLGSGWKVAMTTLAHERTAIGQTGAMLEVDQLLDLVRRSGRAHDRLVRQRTAQLVTRLRIARLNAARSSTQPPAMGSGAKLWMSDTMKAAAALAVDLYGPAAVAGGAGDPEAERWRTLFLTGPSLSIRGGTDEVMRNILGERVLGLPPEPRVDKDVPFRSLPR